MTLKKEQKNSFEPHEVAIKKKKLTLKIGNEKERSNHIPCLPSRKTISG